MKRRRRPRRQPTRPWTPEEDAKLREVNEIFLCHEYWHFALPERGVHEMIDRRYVLGIKPARLI